MYKQIIEDMYNHNIRIWDDVYPCDFFERDIDRHQLYILLEKGEIVSAFALSDRSAGEKAVKWNDMDAKAVYIDRLGVHIHRTRKGIGSLALGKAKEIAKAHGAEYLRLFAVDINTPAIQLYLKNGCVRAEGVYEEIITDTAVLHEYGYEWKLEQS